MSDLFEGLDKPAASDAPADPFEGLDAAAPAPAKPAPGSAVDTAKDAAVGLGTGLAYDFDDELVGALAKFKNFAKFVPLAGPLLDAGGAIAQGATGETEYAPARDAYRQRKLLAERRSPVANTAGQFVGAGAPALATGGASFLEGGLLKTGAKLAAEGAVQGVGASEAEDVEGMAQDALTGAQTSLAVGGALHAGGKVAGGLIKGVGNTSNRLARGAERSEVAAAGLNPRMVAKEPGGVAGQAARQRKQGIGGPLAGKETILEQSSAAQAARHSEREALAADFSARGVKVDGALIGANLRQRAAKLDPIADSARVATLKKYADAYEQSGIQPFAQVNKSRSAWAKKMNPQSEAEKSLVQEEVHTALNDVLEFTAEAQGGRGMGAKWRSLGQDEAAAIRAERGAEDYLGRQANNRLPSPSDQGAALVGAAAGGAPGAMALGGANRLIRGRERSAFAAMQRGGSRVLRPLSRPATALGTSIQAVTPAIASAAGRHVAAGQARVQSASRKGPEEAAREHFLESMTNPAYAAETRRKEDKEDGRPYF